jgi:ketosteroid isomerase-like protein
MKEAVMLSTRIRLIPAVLLAVLALGNGGCAVRPSIDHRPLTDAWRAAVADTIRTLIEASAGHNFMDDCETAGEIAWLPDQAPLVHFSAEDRIIRLENRDQITAYCRRIARGRISTHEEIEEQTVHLLSADAAYVVTRSTQTTQWQDGRTEVTPTVETAIVARQGGRWRVVYKHLSWRAPTSPPSPAGS